MEPVEITGEALRLRLPGPADVTAITRACQDPLIQRWIPVPLPYERAHAAEWVDGTVDSWARDDELRWVAVDPGTDEVLGAIGLHARDATMREIGYWAAPWARGRGVTTTAARLACRFGFEVLGLARIEWWAAVGNDASWRVAERLGFRREGTCRARLLHRDVRIDAWVAGLLPGELR